MYQEICQRCGGPNFTKRSVYCNACQQINALEKIEKNRVDTTPSLNSGSSGIEISGNFIETCIIISIILWCLSWKDWMIPKIVGYMMYGMLQILNVLLNVFGLGFN